jgi:hypothetical protein
VSQSLADGVVAVHNSATNPHPIVRVATTLSDHFAGAPDEVEVNLTFGGVHQGTVFYSGNSGTGFAPGDEVVFAMQADATGWATGRYDWTMTARLSKEHKHRHLLDAGGRER